MSSTVIPPFRSTPEKTLSENSQLPARERARGVESWMTSTIAVLGALYLLQLAAPLRIDNDSVAYLVAATHLADQGLPSTSALPVGYPAVVALLMRAGIANAKSLMLLNIASIGAAIGSLWWISRDRPRVIRLAAVAMTLLSYPILRSAIMAQPDALCFGLMMGAVAVTTSITSARTAKNFALLAAAAGLTIAACATRMAAVTLVLPLLWCALHIAAPRGDTRTKLAIAAGLVLAALLVVGVVIASSEAGTLERYQTDVANVLASLRVSYPVSRLTAMSFGMGELTLNGPVVTLPVGFRLPLAVFGMVPLGLFLFTWRRARWRPQVSVFVAGYLAMLAIWPFYVTRLFIPVIPFILLHFATMVAVSWNRKPLRSVALAFVACFSLGGLLSLGWTTHVSLSGERFRGLWGTNGGLASPGFEDSDHNRNALIVLERLDPAHPAWRRLLAGDTSKVVPPR